MAFDKNLIDTHSGNISMGIRDTMLITVAGKSLIDLKDADFTTVPLRVSVRNKPNKEAPHIGPVPSSEIEVHRFILQSFPDSTVFHSHPPSATALSILSCNKKVRSIMREGNNEFTKNQIKNAEEVCSKYPETTFITPLDFETRYFFPQIPVYPLSFTEDIKKGRGFADFKKIGIFGGNGVFMVKSHGSFAWGKTPLDALRWTLVLETAAKLILLASSH